MGKLAEVAEAKFLAGYNCAQAVVFAACDRLGFDQDTALKISCGFGGGMGRAQEVCGAASGGIIALGLRYGRGAADGAAHTENTYAKTREFLARFRQMHGSLACRDLLKGCNLQTDEGQQQFRDGQLKTKVCAVCVASAAQLVDEFI